MNPQNQLSLFGVDLSIGVRRIKLGVRQLLWGDEAGLRQWFCPPLALTYSGDVSESVVAEIAERGWAQLVIPGSQTLETVATLPVQAEIYLDEAIESHVLSSSPFSPERTCWGYNLRERSATGDLLVDIVILSKEAASRAIALIQDNPGCRNVAVSLWAEVHGSPVEIRQMNDERWRTEYLANLRGFTGRLLLGVLGLLFLCSVPVFWFAQEAEHYSSLRRDVELRAAEVSRVRQTLVDTRDKLESAHTFLSAQPTYRRWLHKIAEVTPDNVYLSRLSLEGTRLTLSGLAENAADYQSSLAETGLFSEITAPSAFTLDARAGGERFSLIMVINSGEDG